MPQCGTNQKRSEATTSFCLCFSPWSVLGSWLLSLFH